MPPPAEEPNPAVSSMKRFIHLLNGVRKLHLELIEDDGKLIGQERHSLIEKMDEALSELIQLRSLLDNKRDFSAFNSRYNYRLRVRIIGTRWEGHGLLGIFRQMKINQFQVWLSRIIKERMVKIIQFFGVAMQDGVLDKKELIILHRSLDRLLFSIILAREHVRSGKLH